MPSSEFVCVDWGTSSLRLWKMSSANEVLAKRRSKEGMSTLARDQFDAVLERHLSAMSVGSDVPVVICGMAGAAQGWQEVPYFDLPARLAEIAAAAVTVNANDRDVRILPGLAQRPPASPDVIRGEETMLLGAELLGKAEGLFCLPGTHSKWIAVSEGSVSSFSTVMTGEVFALLSQHSTLSHFLKAVSVDYANSEAFKSGVEDALEKPEAMLSALFSIRSTPLLLGTGKAAEMPSRLSGLLIGSEVASMKDRAAGSVQLIANGSLAVAYTKALGIAGIQTILLNAEELVLAGLSYAADAIWS